jgi:C4-dicarboxylate-specific signal transduction histidine kinase
VAVKKLKLESQPFLAPEGLYALPTAVLLYQKSTGTLWANPYFEKEFGTATAERFVPQKTLHLIQERPVHLTVFTMIGRHEGYVLQNNRHEKVPVEIKVSQFGDASNETFLIMVEDVSVKIALEKQVIQNHLELQKNFEQQKKTQNALIQTAKLASLGEMATGLAHELNQPLQAIMGFSQEMLQSEKFSPSGQEFMNDIVNASRKMAEIIKSLRSFARQSGEELSETSVEHVIEESVRLMRHHLMQKSIDVETHFINALPLIEANPIQFEQVLINMISNARDAIESSGKTRGKINISAERKNDFVELHIRDNGCGMDENTRQKIFDPFFTTKEVDRGTGLGMSISYGILKKMHAEISIQSEVGKGTEFTIIIPVLKTDTKGERHEQ